MDNYSGMSAFCQVIFSFFRKFFALPSMRLWYNK